MDGIRITTKANAILNVAATRTIPGIATTESQTATISRATTKPNARRGGPKNDGQKNGMRRRWLNVGLMSGNSKRDMSKSNASNSRSKSNSRMNKSRRKIRRRKPMFNETIENHLARPIADAELPVWPDDAVICADCRERDEDLYPCPECHRLVCGRCLDLDDEDPQLCVDCRVKRNDRAKSEREALGDELRVRRVELAFLTNLMTDFFGMARGGRR